VPALVAEDTWQRVQRRLEDNKRYAARNSRNPSLLQGICACSSCGYAYYRTSTRTTNKKIYYYGCLGSDDYRYEHGRVCANKPVRADYLDTVVWNHITALLADPALIRNEINKRLEQVRTADPATVERQRLDAGLAKATTAITRLIGAYQEELISLDELRTRMPELRARQTSLHHQIDALDSQLADREVYLKLADNLEDFLTGLRGKAATATVAERQRVLRLLVKDVLVGAEKITIRHSIPVRHNVSSGTDDSPETDSEGEIRPDCQLRWRSHRGPLRGAPVPGLQGHVGQRQRRGQPPLHIQHHPRNIGVGLHRLDHESVIDTVERSPVLSTGLEDVPSAVRITRPRHPLQNKLLQVLGGMRRHGVVELLLVLPDGSKSLVPAAWTDAKASGADGEGVAATLGSLTDLLQVCELVTGLSPREPREQGQAAGMSPCKEDSRAACPAQFDTRSAPDLNGRSAAGAAGTNSRATARRRGHDGDHVAGQRDRQSRRSETNRGGRR
jgi:hypothetical protein